MVLRCVKAHGGRLVNHDIHLQFVPNIYNKFINKLPTYIIHIAYFIGVILTHVVGGVPELLLEALPVHRQDDERRDEVARHRD